MSEPEHKLRNFENALARLTEGIAKYDETNDLIRDGLIQRFEFTFELAWKTLQTVFQVEGLTGLNSPKTVLREALAAELISDEELWLDMLRDRNSTTHIYSEQTAIRICSSIQRNYVFALGGLLERIKLRLGA